MEAEVQTTIQGRTSIESGDRFFGWCLCLGVQLNWQRRLLAKARWTLVRAAVRRCIGRRICHSVTSYKSVLERHFTWLVTRTDEIKEQVTYIESQIIWTFHHLDRLGPQVTRLIFEDIDGQHWASLEELV